MNYHASIEYAIQTKIIMSQDYHWEARRLALAEGRKHFIQQLKSDVEEKRMPEESTISNVYTIEADKFEARNRHNNVYSARLPYRFSNIDLFQQR